MSTFYVPKSKILEGLKYKETTDSMDGIIVRKEELEEFILSKTQHYIDIYKQTIKDMNTISDKPSNKLLWIVGLLFLISSLLRELSILSCK